MTNIYNIPLKAKSFFLFHYLLQQHKNKNFLLLTPSEEEAINAYNAAIFFSNQLSSSPTNNDILISYFPSYDTIPFDRVSPNPLILAERAKVLSNLVISNKNQRKVVITNSINLLQQLPPKEVFTRTSIKLIKGMKFTSEKLVQFLIDNGFNRNSNAIEGGEFAVRGEIVDIVLPPSLAYRINFGWGEIESIKTYDIESQISIDNQAELTLHPATEIILSSETINNFRDNFLTTFGVNYIKTPIYESIIEGRKFPGYEHLLPLFYQKLDFIISYLNDPLIIYDNFSMQALFEYDYSCKDLYHSRLQSNKVSSTSFYPVLAVEQLYFKVEEVKKLLLEPSHIFIDPASIDENPAFSSSSKIYTLKSFEEDFSQKKTSIDKLAETILANKTKIIVIFNQSASAIERMKNIIESLGHKFNIINQLNEAKVGIINLTKNNLEQGFSTEEYLFISDQDIFGRKFATSSPSSSKKRLKNILTELDNLEEGELVVHKEYGIGKFITVETIEVKGQPHDCLKILYAGNDRLYLPVENIETIKKYGNFEAELDKLGSLSWQKRKSSLKKRITEIAKQLLQTVAKRALNLTSPLEFDIHSYEKFCSKFNYVETEDQLKAIEEVKNDLTAGRLMDRLICGDVGFGKTEIAMRASFMVAANSLEPSQIAIIAPTTILCKQHFSRFSERFKDFGFNIAQLSRLIKPSEAKKIKEQIKTGQVQIIIGTHALLANDIKFNNLKLLIIDEEQHFGVSQKERLKQIKSDVHVLSLSATPIPRTLQMSLSGLKELSLIATPPVDRLTIRTTITPFDPVIIRDALLREHFRGGKSFYVCPRIKDIEEVEKKLKEIVPELKYKIAHGQMPPSIVDEVMNEFFEGKFDILLSTTIIESGIDISTANTMIVHKADILGLSQLYQLRGRIGRSKIRAYAYFTLENSKKVNKVAIKRLEIMQNANSLGAGFTIASHDMDLRGFGNLVGEEQSGHIKEIGIELYQEMLEEEIANLKQENLTKTDNYNTSINLSLPVLIPDVYISDSSLRLGIYRRIGNLTNLEEIENFKDEMIDRFGPLPIEFENLLHIVKFKQICKKLGIESLDSGAQGFVIKFHTESDIADLVMKFINKYPRFAKIKPDNKLIFMKNLEPENVIEETKALLNNLYSCSDK